MCSQTAATSRSHSAPIVLGNGRLDHCSMDSWVMNPAKIIKGPNALSGRLRQATIPAKMYGSVIHQTSRTRSAGW